MSYLKNTNSYMDLKEMQQIADAYEKIKTVSEEIISIQATAEKALELSSPVWISMDFETELLKEMSTQQPNVDGVWFSTTASGSFMIPDNQQPEMDDDFTMRVPDTVALEILGVIHRYKQQILDNENNNIQRH